MTLKGVAAMLVCAAALLPAVLLLSGAFADTGETEEEIYSVTGADELWGALPDEVQDLLSELGIETLESTEVAKLDVSGFISALIPSLESSVARPLKSGGILLAAVLVCVLTASITEASSVISKVGVAVCAVIMLSPLAETLTRMTAVMDTSAAFTQTYVPVCAGLAASSGLAGTAAVYSGFQLGICALAETLSANVIIPVTGMLTALCAVTSVEETPASAVTEFTMKAVKWFLGLTAVVSGGMFSLQTGLAASADSISLRSAKFALSGMVPVVGGALSDALGTVVSAASVIRSAVGIVGIIAVSALFLPVLAELGMWSLMCKMLSFFAGSCGAAPLEKMFSRMGGVTGILMGVAALAGAMLIFSTAVLMKAGGAT